jgi:GH25 family lysozyme M1 (1,4-beta-N-acetylmuramidase)
MNINITYAITPSSNQQYQGIYVSDWQGYIDYSKVSESGIEIVYIKASQGSNIKDPYFDINYENAKANGLKVGFYHFLTASSTR